MFSKEIEDLLHKSLQSVPYMLSGRSLKNDIDDLVGMSLARKRLAVVDDNNTAKAFGDQIARALKGRFDVTRVTLAGTPVADQNTVQDIRQMTSTCEALVAVGSGTISDLCKYTSFLAKKPYAVFPTAASMNGYCSANASITVDGIKKTLPAHMPKGVFCDLSIIAEAPPRLNKSGFGDSLARSTAQTDWLMSHTLLGTPYTDVPFALLRPIEPKLLESARGIALADRPATDLLMQTLLLSGLGMTIATGSYPASQGEHMVAHTLHLLESHKAASAEKKPAKGKKKTNGHYHGEEIGVTTLAIARIQEKLLRDKPRLRPMNFEDATIESLFGKPAIVEAQRTYISKRALIDRANLTPEILHKRWDKVLERVDPIMLPMEKIELALKQAEAPDSPEMLGWQADSYETALTHARLLRDRFTFLDLE